MATDNNLVSNKPKPFVYLKSDPLKTQNNWKMWKAEFLIYLGLSEHQLHEDKKGLFLLNIMGADGIRALENVTFDNPDDKNDLDILLGKFDDLFDPLRNESEVLARYEFFNCRKKGKEDFDNFVERLKEKARSCNFGSESEKLIRDMLILNLDKDTRDCVFAHKESDLLEILKIVKIFCFQIDQIKEKSRQEVTQAANVKHTSNNKPIQENTLKGKNEDSAEKKPCWRCKTIHKFIDCPASGVTCAFCKKKGHFDENCPTNAGCSKCGEKHAFKACPAHNFKCSLCSEIGHFASKCKKNGEQHIPSKAQNPRRQKQAVYSQDNCKDKRPPKNSVEEKDTNNFPNAYKNSNYQLTRNEPPPSYAEAAVVCGNPNTQNSTVSNSPEIIYPNTSLGFKLIKDDPSASMVSETCSSANKPSTNRAKTIPTAPNQDCKEAFETNYEQSYQSSHSSRRFDEKFRNKKDKNDKEPCVIS